MMQSQSQITCARACLKITMQKVLFLMTIQAALIILKANASTPYKHQRSMRNGMNQCLDNPCQNGGTFKNNDGCFTCTCANGWTGTRCNEAVSNLALNKPAGQSSTFTWLPKSFPAEMAVDGNNGTDFEDDGCSSTVGGDTNPWWRVDLQAVYSIESVRIFNRGMDKHGIDAANRLRDVTVTVGMTESDVSTPCGVFAGPGTLSQVVDISCPIPLPKGRFVKISKPTDYLTLCEVEVFGYSG
ncbi:fucolectin-1-like [Crassostrea angulata]|uniref:fucolectin-1-like n=1 Tax=Magallana angulata TaxID=2784310 RepID=UPI0022B1058F|nr:fucolectin-1-like [Crassostrea angulata]